MLDHQSQFGSRWWLYSNVFRSVLPKFEVTVELPAFALSADDNLMGTVRAKYVFVFDLFRFVLFCFVFFVVSIEINAGIKICWTSIFVFYDFTVSYFFSLSVRHFQLNGRNRDFEKSGLKSQHILKNVIYR